MIKLDNIQVIFGKGTPLQKAGAERRQPDHRGRHIRDRHRLQWCGQIHRARGSRR